MTTKHILLLGHRQQHGKDSCCDILEEIFREKGITYCRTFFAELLKKQVADRYDLDALKMEDDEYKKWCPPWIEPKEVTVFTDMIEESYEEVVSGNSSGHVTYKGKKCKIIGLSSGLEGLFIDIIEQRSVRDILIEEGCKARSIWKNAWANSAYMKIVKSNAEIGIISDYRFPNEYRCYKECLGEDTQIRLHRILVNRPSGVYKNDGADGELPDTEDPSAWDYIIHNDIEGNGWKKHLTNQIVNIIEHIGIIIGE